MDFKTFKGLTRENRGSKGIKGFLKEKLRVLGIQYYNVISEVFN